MDSITRTREIFLNWASELAQIHYLFLWRALLLYGLTSLLCGWARTSGSRSIPLQGLCAAVGLLLATTIPVHGLVIANRQARGWFLLCGVVLLAFLPSVLATLIVPTVGMQRKARIVAYVVLAVLFLVNLLLAWSQR